MNFEANTFPSALIGAARAGVLRSIAHWRLPPTLEDEKSLTMVLCEKSTRSADNSGALGTAMKAREPARMQLSIDARRATPAQAVPRPTNRQLRVTHRGESLSQKPICGLPSRNRQFAA